MSEYKAIKILVVDDSVVQRNHVIEVCGRFGIEQIDGAENGEDAVNKLKQKEYDLAFIDLEMPVMDGIELVRAIAAEKLVESVIILSSKDPVLILSVGTMAESDGLKVLGTFQKPILQEHLECSLKRLLESAGATEEATEESQMNAQELLDGIQSNQLGLVYQPKLQVEGLLLKGVEALARWEHPEHGVIPPARFIPVAERFGLIQTLTDHLFDIALRQKSEWKKMGLNVDLAFNLSPLSISDKNLADHVSAMVDCYQIKASEVILEITENAVAGELSAAIESLAKLRLKGFKVAIDDYGTGFANTQQLSRVPATELKLDRSMIDNVATRPQNQAIVRSTLQLAKDLDLNTIAEGVETLEDFRFLKEEGVDQVQGYYFAKPMKNDKLIEWLKTNLSQIRHQVKSN